MSDNQFLGSLCNQAVLLCNEVRDLVQIRVTGLDTVTYILQSGNQISLEMALVLQRQLPPNTTALVGGYCYRPIKTLRAGGENGLVGECPSMSISGMKRLQMVVRRETQHQMRSNIVTAVLLQSSSSSPVKEASQLHSCEANPSSAKVFEDQAHGICCYRSPTGEVTCEGYDEGPHFQPAECCPERTTEGKSWICDSLPNQEVFAYKYVMGGQGKCWCEGKDES